MATGAVVGITEAVGAGAAVGAAVVFTVRTVGGRIVQFTVSQTTRLTSCLASVLCRNEIGAEAALAVSELSGATAGQVTMTAAASTAAAAKLEQTAARWVGGRSVLRTAEDVNAEFVALRAGNKAPWKQGTNVEVMVTTQEEKYVRVFNGTDPRGGWIMKESEIHALNPAQIKEKFALPSLPSSIDDVTVPQGTTIYIGTAGTIPEWGQGGGPQFYLPNRIDGSLYTNVRPLN